MSVFPPTLQSIEEYLDHLQTARKSGAMNIAAFESLSKPQYDDAVAKIDYWEYIQTADYHYFISRLLWFHRIAEYSCFSGHQCIENYLKAFLKCKNQQPPNSHKLLDLLVKCRACAAPNDTFFQEDRASIILAKYEPFYELARYPVQRSRPKSPYAFLFPDDIVVLDYFVHRMRGILTIPAGTWDLIQRKEHFHLHQCQQDFPDFCEAFFANNINFPHKTEDVDQAN